jgi:hypothetical protein
VFWCCSKSFRFCSGVKTLWEGGGWGYWAGPVLGTLILNQQPVICNGKGDSEAE